MPNLPTIVFAPLAILATTSCTESFGILTQEESLATIPARQNVSVGRRMIDPYDAGVIFADVCLVRGENFEHYAYGLRVHNVTRDAETSLFAHNRYSLSVRIADGQCSVLFYSEGPLEETLAEIVVGANSIISPLSDGIELSSFPTASPDGRMYYIGIDAPVILAPNSVRGG